MVLLSLLLGILVVRWWHLLQWECCMVILESRQLLQLILCKFRVPLCSVSSNAIRRYYFIVYTLYSIEQLELICSSDWQLFLSPYFPPPHDVLFLEAHLSFYFSWEKMSLYSIIFNSHFYFLLLQCSFITIEDRISERDVNVPIAQWNLHHSHPILSSIMLAFPRSGNYNIHYGKQEANTLYANDNFSLKKNCFAFPLFLLLLHILAIR